MINIKNKYAFTLIEILIVIAIIGIIAVVAFVALDPARRFADSRDSARWADVTALLDAIKVDQVDNGGTYLPTIASMTAGLNFQIGTAGGAVCAGTACDVTLQTTCVNAIGLATEGYLAAIPFSPSATTAWDAAQTGYYANRSTTGAITVGACEGENDTISVSR